MTVEELERLDRERRDADARYNAALTALDHSIVAAQKRPLSHDDAARLGTPLLEFLQQITAFVETRDRHLAAESLLRAAALERALEPVAELATQTRVLQRAVEMLQRSAVQPAAVGGGSPAPSSPRADRATEYDRTVDRDTASSAATASSSHVSDYKYVGFEDQFRGRDAEIEERLQAYVPIFAGASNVVDLGCGRGEFLVALRAAGITASGVDANREMVAAAAARGVAAVHGDALAYLSALPDASLGGIIATQVVEHLEPPYLTRLLDECARTLRAGAPIVLETINAACWLAFFSSYLRDLTHVRPIHPDTLQYLLRASGFDRVTLRYSAPVPDHMKMQSIDLPAAVVAGDDATASALSRIAHAVNANAVVLNNLMFTHLDYAAIGYRM